MRILHIIHLWARLGKQRLLFPGKRQGGAELRPGHPGDATRVSAKQFYSSRKTQGQTMPQRLVKSITFESGE
jgi:hypothetical protein